ncbi:hypothetical protein BGZ89_005804 [Linnemannia elongata]|nr:hypothetical protein BGZ89_005804 [Linnemannia elongata]
MQALTPLLFAMLFPRFSNTKNTTDMSPDAEGNYPIESLLGGRNSTSNSSYRNSTSSELLASSFSFGEGYPVDNNNLNNNRSAKARRHHSTGTLLDTAQSSSSSTSPMNNNIRRNNTVPQVRRTSRPERLSIDHAAFIATYPSLDGLGDMGYRSSSVDYYRNNNNTANTANSSPSPRRKASSSKLRKQQSQETLPASRASTSSIASMVSDTSSSTSCSSSVSSVREPLTPTKASNYHSIDGIDAVSSTKKSSKRASMPVSIVRSNNKNTLINFESFAAHDEQEEENRVKSLAVCQSPQSDNFFSTEESFAGSAANNSSTASSDGVVKARGQRQLIAH